MPLAVTLHGLQAPQTPVISHLGGLSCVCVLSLLSLPRLSPSLSVVYSSPFSYYFTCDRCLLCPAPSGTLRYAARLALPSAGRLPPSSVTHSAVLPLSSRGRLLSSLCFCPCPSVYLLGPAPRPLLTPATCPQVYLPTPICVPLLFLCTPFWPYPLSSTTPGCPSCSLRRLSLLF